MSVVLLNPATPSLWTSNSVLSGRSRVHDTPEMEGTLSIKSVIHGCGIWSTPSGAHRVREGTFLVLNGGQRYSLQVRTKGLTHTFCVFFKPGFVGSVAAGMEASAERLLEPADISEDGGFYEQLAPADDLVWPQLMALRRLVESDDLGWEAHEQLMRLSAALLQSREGARRSELNLGAAKASTRAEIFRRLGMAREFMLDNLGGALDLDSIAAAAYLSPFHFHRLFKKAYGETPHEFLRDQRLRLAMRLLKGRDVTVADVCRTSGFISAGTFCALFKRTTGLTPTEYRNGLSRKRSYNVGEEIH